MLVTLLALLLVLLPSSTALPSLPWAAPAAHAAGTNVDSVRFIQYLDENTALEEVRNGNLDMYYFRVPSDRIENTQAREGLKIYESTGGSYSILVNPAESSEFNPFFDRDARFALNYLVDRKLVVNELMGGYGVPMISNYGPFDPEYLTVLNQLEKFQFRHNPKLAEHMISGSLESRGAEKVDDIWTYKGEPVNVTVFIRSDDPVRKSIGEILASGLESMGFEVTREFGDLNKAFVVVYGSDPAENRWNLYTEGWGGRSAFVRYDPVGMAQMYAPWFSNMPGFNDPSYWNYENELLDELTQRIYTGDFESAEQRGQLIREATAEAVNEAVRIFLASKVDQYVANQDVDGVINDFGAGVPTRFTPINAHTGDSELRIGVKQIYQGAWNPVRGLTDSYSIHIWSPVNDPAVFKHPFTGNTIPIRAQWDVETTGNHAEGQGIEVPDGAVMWDPESQSWKDVAGSQSTSKVTFDLDLGKWHDGEPMDMHDVLYSVYFAQEWGTRAGEDDRTFDAEYTPQAAQMISTLVGVRPVGETRIEVYVDYWHFDRAEIAGWASVWSAMPWQIFAAMEELVLDGKASFSRSGAVSKNTGWLSLIVPNDAHAIRENLARFAGEGFVPAPLAGLGLDAEYFESRYASSIGWIERMNHAVISNGPFYLESYAPESRTITLATFEDPAYPFESGHWAGFEDVRFPTITGVDLPSISDGAGRIEVRIHTADASEIRYFVSGSGGVIDSGTVGATDASSTIWIPAGEMGEGTYGIKVFASSEDVLRPDFYETSFVIADGATGFRIGDVTASTEGGSQDTWIALVVTAAVVTSVGAVVVVARRRSAGRAV